MFDGECAYMYTYTLLCIHVFSMLAGGYEFMHFVPYTRKLPVITSCLQLKIKRMWYFR